MKVQLAAIFAVRAVSRPNVILLMADDLGWGDVGFNNHTYARPGTPWVFNAPRTPNLDAMAAADSSLVFWRFYAGSAVCSPTRSALMTGRYPLRLGTQSNVIYWDTPWGIDLNETFLPQNLQDAGYSTAMFGKWHLGMFKEAYTPMQRGFEQHLGYYQGCGSAWTHVASCCTAGSPHSDQDFVCGASQVPGITDPKDYRGYDWFKSDAAAGVSLPDFGANHTNSVDLIRDAAIGFVRAQTPAKPFFLYLPFQNIHGPYTTQQKVGGVPAIYLCFLVLLRTHG